MKMFDTALSRIEFFTSCKSRVNSTSYDGTHSSGLLAIEQRISWEYTDYCEPDSFQLAGGLADYDSEEEWGDTQCCLECVSLQ